MATMIPENVETFNTEGEMRFFKFMELVADGVAEGDAGG